MIPRDPRIDPRARDVLGDSKGILRVKSVKRGSSTIVMWVREPKKGGKGLSFNMVSSLSSWQKKMQNAIVLIVHNREIPK
jgi:hypothetical protein